jgi:hypothetical protein
MISKILFFLCILKSSFLLGQIEINGVVKDSVTKKTLSFASIRISGKSFGTITNNEGNFHLSVKNDKTEIWVSYIGYESKRYIIDENDTFLDILLKSKVENISEFTITDISNIEISQIIRNIKKSIKKQKTIQSKSFLRYYTYQNDTVPKELLEGYFNTKSNLFGIRSLKLKAGKIIIPKNKNYFLSLDIISNLLKEVNLFNDNNSNYSKLSPLFNKNIKNNNSLFTFNFFNMNDSINTISYNSDSLRCSGDFFYNKHTLQVYKIDLTKKYYTNFPIESINKTKKIDSLILNLTINYDLYKENIYIDYFRGSLEFNYTSINKKENKKIRNSFILKQYDINNQFKLPLNSSEQRKKTDYEKILLIPYNPLFWSREFVFKKTNKEKKFYNVLLKKDYYLNRTPFINWDIEKIDSSFSLNWNLIDDSIPVRNLDEIDLTKSGNLLNITDQLNNYDIKKRYNIETAFLCNYSIYKDTILFDTMSFIDYKKTYFNLPRDTMSEIFIKSVCFQTKINTGLLLKSLNSISLNNLGLEEIILNTIKKYELKQKKDVFILLKKVSVKTNKNGENYLNILKDDLNYMKSIIFKGKSS